VETAAESFIFQQSFHRSLIMNKYMSLKTAADCGNFRGSFAPQKYINCV
jgi:hypothetical protein